jgi:S-adenosylmethionine decarboxylase
MSYFVERDGSRFAGTHLLVDLVGARHLDDRDRVEGCLRACVAAMGATLLHLHLHCFTENGGITAVAVLAESHMSIHTWPELEYAAVDAFLCGARDPSAAVPVLEQWFRPSRTITVEHRRGHGLL